MIKCTLDVKSGKVMPWAAIQTAAYTLLDSDMVELEPENHIYFLENGDVVPSVTEILEAEGAIDKTYYDEYSRTRGSNVHLARHLNDMDQLGEATLGEVERPYLEAWRLFIKESGFVLDKSEIPMVNLQLFFAGTPDATGHFPSGTLTRAAVELHKDGSYRLIPFTNRQDVNIWKSCLGWHYWKQNHLRR